MTVDDIKTISLKSVKVHDDMSEETMCFSATIYVNGKKAGDAKNNGHGGCNYYYMKDGFEESVLEEWAKQKTGETFEALDSLLFDLIQDYEEEKQFKRWCKKWTVLRLNDTPKGQWITLSIGYSPLVKTKVHEKYGDSLEEILNERFVK